MQQDNGKFKAKNFHKCFQSHAMYSSTIQSPCKRDSSENINHHFRSILCYGSQ